MPKEGVYKKEHSDIISFENIENVVKACVLLGIDKFRITGGEPLVRKGIVALVEKLANIKGVKELAITTNGILLNKYAQQLKQAGLTRLNISLDTLDDNKYSFITRGGKLSDVLMGIEAASFFPIKINVVLMKGFNDDEILNFANLTLEKPIDVRFIELMPIGTNKNDLPYEFMSCDEAKQKLPKLTPEVKDDSVASYYKLQNGIGKIGFISPLSNSFCSECNKIRLTADGKLKACLHSNDEVDIKSILKTNDVELIKQTLEQVIFNKPKKHLLLEGAKPINREMNRIGG